MSAERSREERIELRVEDGPLLGILVPSTSVLEIKKGARVFEIDLPRTLAEGVAVVVEREFHRSPGTTGPPFP